MKIHLVSTIAAAALLSGAGFAQAQDRGQQDRSMNFDRPVWSERMERGQDRGQGTARGWTQESDQGWGRDQGRQAGADRRGEAQLRNVLREAGFGNIRILDAAYLVEARAPDGTNVTMFIDPPRRDVGRPMARGGEGFDMRDRMGERDRMGGRMGDRMSDRMGDRDRMRRQMRDPALDPMRERMQDMMQGRMQGEMQGGMQSGMEDGMQDRMREHMQEMRRGGMQDMMRGQMEGRMPESDFRADRSNREPPHSMQWTEPFDFGPSEEARRLLQAQGMENVRNVEQIGENEFAATADWYGQETEVEVNVRTGEIIEPQRMSESQIRNRLEDRGWQDVRDIQRNEDVFEVTADREGQSFRLMVDAENGLLLRWREAG